MQNLDQTKQFMVEMQKRTREYTAKIGKRPDDQLLINILYEGMDDKTADDLDEALDTSGLTFKKVCNFIKKKAQRKLVRANLRKRGSDKMDLGLVGGGEPLKEQPDEPLNALKGQQKGKGKGKKGVLTC